jgi:hypothetical protein
MGGPAWRTWGVEIGNMAATSGRETVSRMKAAKQAQWCGCMQPQGPREALRAYTAVYGDGRHVEKIEARMREYGCIRSKRHLKDGACPSQRAMPG